MVALKRGEKTVLRFWISKFWAFVYQTFPKDLKAWYYYHKPNIWGKEMKSQCFSLYIKWSFYSERREVKEKVVGREAQSLETGGVSEKGLCSALPTPGLEEMPMISRIWEQRALWSCISGESQKPLALPVPTTMQKQLKRGLIVNVQVTRECLCVPAIPMHLWKSHLVSIGPEV